MKITIDDKICLKHGLTPNEVMLALAIRTGEMKEDISNMIARGILIDKGEYLVTQHWSDVIDEILCDSGGNLDENRLLKLALKIQESFPSGFKRDEKTGTKYFHKSNKTAIKLALKRFITTYGDYSDEDILDATKRYVASFRGNYNPPFKMANYFVIKDNTRKGGGIESSLADFLENKESEEGVEITNSDEWLMNSRN